MDISISLSKTQSYLEWLKTKLYLNSKASSAKGRTVKRGQVYWCHFGINVGSEMSKQDCRPCVILQNDIGNLHSPNTIVAPVTHDDDKGCYLVPFNSIYDQNGKCILDGQVNVSNLLCVSKARLADPIIYNEKILSLPNDAIKNIDKALAQTLKLMRYYKELSDKLEKNKQYIQKLKKDRNEAQDLITEIRAELKIDKNDDILVKIREMVIDKH